MAKIHGTRESKEITLLDGADPATVAVAPDAYVTSNPEYIGGFDKVAIHLKGTAVSTGGGSFWVQVSSTAIPADEDWVTHSMSDFSGSTNLERTELVASISKMIYFAPDDYAPYVRVQGSFNTDGSYFATLVATS